jgi:hypothetical protein
MLLHQRRQLLAIHNGDSRAAHPSMTGFTRLTPTLFHATRPGWTDVEDDRDLLGLHSAIVGLQNSIS